MENAMAINGPFHLTTPSTPKWYSHAIWFNFKLHWTHFHISKFASDPYLLVLPTLITAIVNPCTVVSFSLSKF